MKTAVSILALCTIGFAANAQTGGFTGPDNRQLVTVAQVAELADDTDVKLVGYIAKSLGDEKYEFSDDSGVIVIEIDDDDWNGVEATPDVRVEIAGEVDKDRKSTEIEVDVIRIAD